MYKIIHGYLGAVALKHSYICLSLTIRMEKMAEKEDTPIKDIQENIWPLSIMRYKNMIQY